MNFDDVWNELAEDGLCDTLGGPEYLRVRSEWISAGEPEDIEVFIFRRANIVPD